MLSIVSIILGAYHIWGALEAVLSAIQVQRPRNGRHPIIFGEGGVTDRKPPHLRSSLPLPVEVALDYTQRA